MGEADSPPASRGCTLVNTQWAVGKRQHPLVRGGPKGLPQRVLDFTDKPGHSEQVLMDVSGTSHPRLCVTHRHPHPFSKHRCCKSWY